MELSKNPEVVVDPVTFGRLRTFLSHDFARVAAKQTIQKRGLCKMRDQPVMLSIPVRDLRGMQDARLRICDFPRLKEADRCRV